MQRVKNARFYAIGADEGSDISDEEQLVIVVRYVDGEGHIREDSLDFAKVEVLRGMAEVEKPLPMLFSETCRAGKKRRNKNKH